MYAEKAQREELKALSTKIWGTSSRWSKFLKHPSFQVPVDQVEHPDSGEYVSINGTRWTASKALEKGLITELPADSTMRVVSRSPTADEMVYMLERVVDERRVTLLDADEEFANAQIGTYAFKVVDGDLEYPWNNFTLVQPTDEDYTKRLSELMGKIDTDIALLLNSRLITEEVSNLVTKENHATNRFDAFEFAEACLHAFDNYNDAKSSYNTVIQELDKVLDANKV